jgi:hypothetical protein
VELNPEQLAQIEKAAARFIEMNDGREQKDVKPSQGTLEKFPAAIKTTLLLPSTHSHEGDSFLAK